MDVCRDGFTHGGVFHADDVFATALLRILNPGIRVSRGFAVPEGFQGIVYDIGGGEFDHHQKSRRVRGNGVPYAAFGLLWERFGTLLLCEEDARKFDMDFIQPLDQSDNNGDKNIFSQIISDRNPTWKDGAAGADEAFWEAVALAQDILESRFHQIRDEREAYEFVRGQALQCKDGILHLGQAMPWKDAVRGLPVVYVIYPSNRGGFNIQAVPADEDASMLKVPFPESWRGAGLQKLQEMTGIGDLSFCHMSGFLCAAGTLEGAYRAARLSANMQKAIYQQYCLE